MIDKCVTVMKGWPDGSSELNLGSNVDRTNEQISSEESTQS